MAELITKDELSNLKSASELREIASAAEGIHERQSVARLLNLAANAGQHSAVWEHPLSDELKTELESLGYVVYPDKHAANPEVMYKIFGF